VQVGYEVALVAHLLDVVGVLAVEHAVWWSSGGEGTGKFVGHLRGREADVPEALAVIAIAE
jgi:hypothetical protein